MFKDQQLNSPHYSEASSCLSASLGWTGVLSKAVACCWKSQQCQVTILLQVYKSEVDQRKKTK